MPMMLETSIPRINWVVCCKVPHTLLDYLTSVSIQSCTNHEYMGPVTAIFATSYTIGGGFAGSIPGAIWTQEMLGEIAAQMIELGAEPSLAMIAYATPYDFIVAYPGTT